MGKFTNNIQCKELEDFYQAVKQHKEQHPNKPMSVELAKKTFEQGVKADKVDLVLTPYDIDNFLDNVEKRYYSYDKTSSIRLTIQKSRTISFYGREGTAKYTEFRYIKTPEVIPQDGAFSPFF